jgi:hypothetical protein
VPGALLLFSLCSGTAPVAAGDPPPIFGTSTVRGDLVVLEWDPSAARAAAGRGVPFTIAGFRLGPELRVDLVVEPFAVTTARTRFVLGQKGGPDRPFDFDARGMAFFRGAVRGRAGSHVFLALDERQATGSIDLGPAAGQYRLSNRGEGGLLLAAGEVSVFRARGAAALPPDIPLCDLHEWDGEPAGPSAPVEAAVGFSVGIKHLELAVDADYEFFELFGNTTDAMAFLVTLYAAMADVYVRDVDTWIELSYVRLWDDPDDLFNDVDPTPLWDFQDHWQTYMGSVQRDAAQLVSGRSDYPFGGQAFLSTLCGSAGYSVVGYMTGAFPDPSKPSPRAYDLMVTAHELGHNAGTGHTQDYGLDNCDNPNSTARRGGIMSYCSQTWSGGNANHDHRFESLIQEKIDNHVNSSSCIVADCNRNGVADSTDISQGAPDVNLNGIPDSCEDCNGNLVLDPTDIASAASTDLNANGVPDDCEPDCDGDGIPDDKEIADGATDAYGNDVPDACEADCNGNLVADYTEIQANMALDVDRDTVLDSCQDCDGDATPDHAALGGAHDVWVASGLDNSVLREFFATTGVKTRTSTGSSIQEGQDLIVAGDGRVLVTSRLDNRVAEFDLAGTYVGNLVPPSAGGLSAPAGLLLTPDGRLLVASRGTDSVLAYDGASGAPLGALVTPGSGGLVDPFGLTLGPNGNLFVTSDAGEVLEFDAADGSFAGVFVSAAGNGGLDQPRGLTFKGDGNLLVASYGTDEVLEYDGTTGAPLGQWAHVGTATNLTQVSPWGIRVGPNGNVFVIRTGEDFGSGVADDHHHENHMSANVVNLHLTNAQIYEYDALSGNFVRTHIGGNDHGMLFPTGFDFVPGWDVDCNANLLPDGCDLASGASEDTDESGVPDECETDCDANGVLDRLDVIPFGASLDCNANLVPDACDVAGGTDCDANGVPDECDPDCNGNGVADRCDIDAGIVTDCNGNDVPDQCEWLFAFESDQGWSTGGFGDDATQGGWERVNPNGTLAQPEYDRTPGDGRVCYVTGQSAVGASAGANDVDGGQTTLTSPALNLAGQPEAAIGYWRWFSNDVGPNPSQDVLVVQVSAGGLQWFTVETVGPAGTEASGGWFFHKFRVADFVTPSATTRVRFVASDEGGASTVEAAIDDFVVLPSCCQTAAACDDALACTLDSCNVPAGQCNSDVQSGSCAIDGLCYAEGDLNPADDCEACDDASPATWSDASPVEVEGVAVDGGSFLAWNDQGNGFVYDVAGGALSALHIDGDVSGAECIENDVAGTAWQDTRPDPAPGDGYYYLIRSQKTCGAGTYGNASSGAERIPVSDCP